MSVEDMRCLISIVTSIGAFSVSGLSIYLGYKLFLVGATGGFTFSSSAQTGIGLNLVSAAPGLGFAAFGMIIASVALFKLIK